MEINEEELLKQFNEEFGSDEELEQDANIIIKPEQKTEKNDLLLYSISSMITEAIKHFRKITRSLNDDERFFYSKESIQMFRDNFTPNPKSKFVVKERLWKNYDAQWDGDRQSHDCWVVYTEPK